MRVIHTTKCFYLVCCYFIPAWLNSGRTSWPRKSGSYISTGSLGGSSKRSMWCVFQGCDEEVLPLSGKVLFIELKS